MATKSNRAKFSASANGRFMVWAFPGDTGNVEFDSMHAAITQEMRERALLSGWKQTIGDAGALSFKQPDGTFRKPSDSERRAAMMERVATLYSGVWSAEREASGGLLYRAIATYRPGRFPTVESFNDWLEREAEIAKSTKKAIIAALEKNPKIAAIMDELRSAVAADVDDEEILDRL
jgi:hypothetical protein